MTRPTGPYGIGEVIDEMGIAELAVDRTLVLSPYVGVHCLCWSTVVTVTGADPLPQARVMSGGPGPSFPASDATTRELEHRGGTAFFVQTDRGRLVVPAGGAALHGVAVVVRFPDEAKQLELLARWGIGATLNRVRFDEYLVKTQQSIRIEGTVRLIDRELVVEGARIATFS